jgi:hypothetical protein
MGSANTDEIKRLRKTPCKEAQEGFKTVTSGISELASVIKGFQTGMFSRANIGDT